MTIIAAVYTRISQDSEDLGLGVRRQEQDCLKLAEAKGWDVVEVFTDNDISATSGKPRPAYQRMVREIEAGRIQGIICWDVDRLTRSPRELEDVIDWADKHGLHLASYGGDVDLATPQGRMTARIKGTVARHETEQLSRRVRRKLQEMAEAGRYVGREPFGWNYSADRQTLVINAAEAEAVREAYQRVLSGGSITGLVTELNRRGITTKAGGQWRTSSLRAMLSRWANCAVKVHNGVEIGPGNWPAIVDREQHERLLALLSDPARRTNQNRGTKPRYLLTGTIRCAECGELMKGTRPGSHSPGAVHRYRCNAFGCHKVSRRMGDLDLYVSGLIVGLLETQGVRILGGDAEAADTARDQIEGLKAKLALAADQWAGDLITADQFSRLNAALKPQLEAAEADLRRAQPAAEGLAAFTGPTARQAWEAAPLEQRRDLLRTLSDAGMKITVGKSGRRAPGAPPEWFDESSITFYWPDA